MKYLITLFLLFQVLLTSAQQTGKVDYKHLGLSFTIPEGWVGQETEGGYLLGSNTIPGMILLLPHDKKYSLDELNSLAHQGINEGNGTVLNLNGPVENISTDGIGGNFQGTLNYEQVKAYLIGIINEYGSGLTIIALTSPEQFDDSYKQYALDLKNNIEFYQPETGQIVKEWKDFLANRKLTFMESYNSYSSVTGGGGYSIKREIDLCAQGYFNFKSNSNMSITGTASSAYSHGNNKGNGTWEIIVDAGGNPILRLSYYSGEYSDYPLAYEDNKLYLNRERYFRTEDSQCY